MTEHEKLLVWKRTVLPGADEAMDAFRKANACAEGQALITKHRIVEIRALQFAVPPEFVEKVKRYRALFVDLGVECPPWTDPPVVI